MKLIIPILSGLTIALATFFPNLIFGILSLIVIAPVFTIVLTQPLHQRYTTGLLFFGSWLIPTTYWYYLIFPWWQAAGQSLGWVALMAAIFVLPKLLHVRKTCIQLFVISATWTLIDTLRQYLPITEDWWIPQLGYAVWQNPLIVQAARVFGVGGVIGVVLGCNGALAYLATHVTQAASGIKSRDLRYVPIVSAFFIFLISITGSLIIKNTPLGTTPITLIALQQQPLGGIHTSAGAEDVKLLIEKSKEALQNVTSEKPIFVVWPENMITTEFDEMIKNFARQEKITLSYNRATASRDEPASWRTRLYNSEPTTDRPFNTAAIVDETGTLNTISIKKHASPGEQITTRDVFTKTTINGLRVTADICYDLHYPDIGERIKKTDLVLGSIDDDRFGRLVPLLHAADIVFRAAEHHTNIFVAGTNGPTFFVSRLGVIQHFLPIDKNGMLTVGIKI